MGLYLEPEFSTRVDEDALISADTKLYAKWSDKYEISSPEDWSLLEKYSDSYFIIKNDINFVGEPIPVIEQFSGILDGQNYTLSNFINQNNSCPVTYGLFCTNKGTISNIKFASGVFTAKTAPSKSTMSVGFVSGINSGTIENIQVADTTVKITCSHSIETNSSAVEGKVFAGVLAGSNRGNIAYSTLTDTVNANLDTKMYAETNYNLSDNYIRVWATYGLIAGGNFGQVDHVTVASSLSSTASRTEYRPTYANYFKYVYFPLRVGGIVGSNEPEGTINDSLSSATVEVDHSVTAARTFLGMLDIGGVSGVNSGKINNCIADNSTQINAYANAETRVGGISGTNEGNGIIKTSYSNATFTVGNRSTTEKTYWGGVVGLNEAAITYCYAVIDSMSINSFATSEEVSEVGNVGGLFGKGTKTSSVLNSFVKIDVAVPHSRLVADALGTHDGAAVMNCYTYLTPKANGFTVSGGITKCDTEADLLTDIGKLGYENMGFTISQNGYPVLPNAGDR